MPNTHTSTDSQNAQIGVIGLGSMGYGMAQSLIRAGFSTYGFDINPEQMRRLAQDGGKSGTLANLPGQLDILVVVVVNAKQLEDVLFGTANALSALRAGGLVIACPTINPDVAKSLEEKLTARGFLYLDAPISGGAARAAAGTMTVMMSGSHAAQSTAQPVLEAMAETIFQLGDKAGPASAMKMVNQLLAGVHIAAAAEAITFGLAHDIPAAQTVEVISKCAGTSWMFENRGPHIVDGDYAPRSAVDIFIKDLGIVSDMAENGGLSVPLAATALQQFVDAGNMGLGREDDAAVAKVYARKANLKLPGEL